MPGTARQTPVGTKLDDGYQSLISFADDPDVSFWEKTVQPPGVEGGDPIDNTNMHATTWRQRSARSLKELTPFTITAGYDPQVIDQIVAMINVEDEITVHLPDGSNFVLSAYLRSFIPAPLVEGEDPEATITVVPTNTTPGTSTEEGLTYQSTGS